ncbi:MAG TPA: hypothetical protein PLN86_16075 [Candidatus Hydrogenedentes bacterium]|nr:hypothetical protein [Candidatus Hydrogenedentota bacterium]
MTRRDKSGILTRNMDGAFGSGNAFAEASHNKNILDDPNLETEGGMQERTSVFFPRVVIV